MWNLTVSISTCNVAKSLTFNVDLSPSVISYGFSPVNISIRLLVANFLLMKHEAAPLSTRALVLIQSLISTSCTINFSARGWTVPSGGVLFEDLCDLVGEDFGGGLITEVMWLIACLFLFTVGGIICDLIFEDGIVGF